jgi:hypothetical protein
LLSVEVQGFVTALILLDVIAMIFGACHPQKDRGIALMTIKALTTLVCGAEAFLKVVAFKLQNVCRDGWTVLDIVIFLFICLLLLIDDIKVNHIDYLLMAARLLRLVTRIMHIRQVARHKVSGNKYRYIDLELNLDLDLSYITEDLVAMGVPAAGLLRGTYRNPLGQVARFFSTKHENHFRIYNACPELPYPDEPFVACGGQIVRFNVEDHSPPTMDQILRFLADTREWKTEDAQNVIAVHCKAGKGRTGTFCCAWLLYSQRCVYAAEALEKFARRRSDRIAFGKMKGVDTPSQVRLVHQVAAHLRHAGAWLASPVGPPPCPCSTLSLCFLELEEGLIAKPARGQMKVLVESIQGDGIVQPVFESVGGCRPQERCLQLGDVQVSGDVRISLYQHAGQDASVGARGHMILSFTFHTAFTTALPSSSLPPGTKAAGIQRFRVPVEELDVAHKRVGNGRRSAHAPGSGCVLSYVHVVDV